MSDLHCRTKGEQQHNICSHVVWWFVASFGHRDPIKLITANHHSLQFVIFSHSFYVSVRIFLTRMIIKLSVICQLSAFYWYYLREMKENHSSFVWYIGDITLSDTAASHTLNLIVKQMIFVFNFFPFIAHDRPTLVLNFLPSFVSRCPFQYFIQSHKWYSTTTLAPTWPLSI